MDFFQPLDIVEDEMSLIRSINIFLRRHKEVIKEIPICEEEIKKTWSFFQGAARGMFYIGLLDKERCEKIHKAFQDIIDGKNQDYDESLRIIGELYNIKIFLFNSAMTERKTFGPDESDLIIYLQQKSTNIFVPLLPLT